MKIFSLQKTGALLLCTICIGALMSCQEQPINQLLNKDSLASHYFKEDAAWYIDNIPFFECSDKEMEAVYYYRWKMYKAHIRSIGNNGFVITEFINHVPWDRDPYCTINAASMHHIYEGRWLKDDRYMNGYINYLFQQGGNNRSYSESIADAAYARYLVNADNEFLTSQLDSMIAKYEAWDDHWDSTKQLYYIAAMPDATEYTIASIDASGGTAGFDGGEAFRPTINSYMYGNALAIAQIAELKNDHLTSQLYLKKAKALKQKVEQDLWNDSLQHFTDRFQQDNQFVHYWDFIRGRELAGMIPWYFNLPSNNGQYNNAWKHVIDTNNLLGPYGFRTNEPSYEYYFKQFVYFEGQRGSQWNGPSWPYQSSQTLTAMANFIQQYDQQVVTRADYVHLLRLYSRQHYLPNGKLNLVENYDPNLGGPIVYYYWSNHYNHSSYNNLIITGLCGVRPSASDSLYIDPLADSSISYFCLDGLKYHGHMLKIVYDADGSKYQLGSGLTLIVDGKKMELEKSDKGYKALIGSPVITTPRSLPKNHALNISKATYPKASASINNQPDSLNQAMDGRIWYFPEITNRWTTTGSSLNQDWFAIEFEKPAPVSYLKVYFVADDQQFFLPDSMYVEVPDSSSWKTVVTVPNNKLSLTANTGNKIHLPKTTIDKIRLRFAHYNKNIALSEIECYE